MGLRYLKTVMIKGWPERHPGELLWRVNENNVRVGNGSVRRRYAHEHNTPHRAATLFVLNDTIYRADAEFGIYIARRSPGNSYAGMWDATCSFHIKYRKTPAQALSDEFLEEGGVSIDNDEFERDSPNLPDNISALNDERPFRYVDNFENVFVYAFVAHHNGSVTLDPNEASHGHFAKAADIKDLLDKGAVVPWFPTSWGFASTYIQGCRKWLEERAAPTPRRKSGRRNNR